MHTWLAAYTAENIIQKAYAFAVQAHAGVNRASGEPYINHCLETARAVHEWGLDEATVAAALLHDVVEDTSYTRDDIQKKFGEDIAFLVEGVTKLDAINYSGNSAQAENIRKLVLAFSKDLRVVFIKLADRLHNMNTLRFLPPETQKRIALETADIYSPLAYRLGMQRLSGELEDLTFPYLHEQEHAWLISTVKEHYEERERYAETAKPLLEKRLREHSIPLIRIDSRAKRYYSLYKKLLRWEMDIGKIHDLVALRVIVPSVADCYAALGVIHKFWPPMPGRIKDYIALPKPNNYRSLHTTVFFVDNKITEIQIRTEDMHAEAEMGIAAHWAYKQKESSTKHGEKITSPAQNHELRWVQQLHEWQKHFTDPDAFLKALKVDFFRDRIFVLTPKREVIDLPVHATPVDFAYRIHSEVGNSCTGARVNGKIVSLDYNLKSGDIVEIHTQKGKKPSESWLEFVKTGAAQQHIRSVMRAKHKIMQKKTEEQPSLELKIITQNRVGFLKDLTQTFHQMRVNIISLHTTGNPKLGTPLIIVQSEVLDEQRLAKLLVRLRQIAGVKEISYKFKR